MRSLSHVSLPGRLLSHVEMSELSVSHLNDGYPSGIQQDKKAKFTKDTSNQEFLSFNRVLSKNREDRTLGFLSAHVQMNALSLSHFSDYYQPEIIELNRGYHTFEVKKLTPDQQKNINPSCIFTCREIKTDEQGDFCIKQPICFPVDKSHVIVCSFDDLCEHYIKNHKKNPITRKPMNFTQWFIPKVDPLVQT